MNEVMGELAAELVAMEADTDTVLEPAAPETTGLAFSVYAKQFKSRLTVLGKITPKNGHMPKINQIRIVAKANGEVWGTAVDFDNILSVRFEGANVGEIGNCVVNLKELTQAIGKSKGIVEVSQGKDGLSVRVDGSVTIFLICRIRNSNSLIGSISKCSRNSRADWKRWRLRPTTAIIRGGLFLGWRSASIRRWMRTARLSWPQRIRDVRRSRVAWINSITTLTGGIAS